MNTGRAGRHVFHVLFFVSGFAALIYQVVWQRVLTQIIGVDSMSTAAIVSIFMAGLGFGSLYARRFTRMDHRSLAWWYCGIELAIGLFGVFSVPLLRAVHVALLPIAPNALWFDFAVNLVVLFPAIFLMGATTPVVMELLKQSMENVGRVTGTLYALNVLGAAFGALATGLVLIELLGLQNATVLAAGCNLLIGVVVPLIVTRQPRVIQPADDTPSATDVPRARHAALCLVAVLFGFGTLALQMVFFRIVMNYLTLSVLSFPILLSAFLLLMAVGNALGGWLADRFAGRPQTPLVALFAAGAGLLLLGLSFPPAWAAPWGGMVFTGFSGSLLGAETTFRIGDPNIFSAFLLSAGLMLAVIPFSAFFPIVVRTATDEIGVSGERFATIMFWYTLGNVFGSFVTGLVILGSHGTIVAAGVTLALLALGVIVFVTAVRVPSAESTVRAVSTARRWQLAGATLATVTVATLLLPTNYYTRFSVGDYRVTDVVEGRNGVVSVLPTKRFYTILDMFRTASASAMHVAPGENDSYEAWRWNLSELMAIDPEFRPKSVLMIGLGHGFMADALLEYDFIERIVIVEISDEVVDAVKKYSAPRFLRFLDDPRVELVIGDGRRYVQKAIASGERFDLVQNKINEPWHAGSSNLFTVEFFDSMRRILTPGGYVAVRPHVGHAYNGMQVFGSCFWTGLYHVYFRDGEFTVPARAELAGNVRDAYLRDDTGSDRYVDRPERSRIRVVQLHHGDLEGYRPNTDDHPTFEYCLLNEWTKQYRDGREFFDYERFAEQTHSVAVRFAEPPAVIAVGPEVGNATR